MRNTLPVQEKTIREEIEELEGRELSPFAALSARTQGRLHPEPECDLRPAYQHDRDRIVHSKAFRRLKHKTQVFLAPTGDHYRTRLTHTLEVSQIARTVARCLRLNESLTEAVALGHDLGHTPFGHAGEDVLNRIVPGGFTHHRQSLRVVDELERGGRGLNLTMEVRDGILKHSKGKGPILSPSKENSPMTLEGQVVRVADIIAYICHDIEDAERGGVVERGHIPKACIKLLGDTSSRRIDAMVRDVVGCTRKADDGCLHMSDAVMEAMTELREFLYVHVYQVSWIRSNFQRATKILSELYDSFLNDDHWFAEEIGPQNGEIQRHRMVCDFIAGMTDRYALDLYERIFLPKPWKVL